MLKALYGESFGFVVQLLKHGHRPFDGEEGEVTRTVARSGSVSVLRALIEAGVDPHVDQEIALRIAVQGGGGYDFVKVILSRSVVSVGASALVEAARSPW